MHHNNLTAVNKLNVKKKTEKKIEIEYSKQVASLASSYKSRCGIAIVTNHGVVYQLALQEERC